MEKGKGVYELSNSRFNVEVTNGNITSLWDKLAGREVIAKGGKGNQLVIFDDKPLYWQAWDVEVFHLESRQELNADSSSSRIIESGPHKVSVVTETKISEESWIKVTISLSAVLDDQSGFVEFDAEVEWRETMKFLKVEFPVDVWNTEASYETQFGIVKRPTHYNTSVSLFQTLFASDGGRTLILDNSGTWPNSKSAVINSLI
jgi:alpha-mannosidase